MGYINLQTMSKEAFDHIEKKEHEQAYKKLSYLLNINPLDAVLTYYLGCLFDSKKEYALAAMAFDRAIQLQPIFDEAYNNGASCYRLLGYVEKAREMFKKAVELAKRPEFLQVVETDVPRRKKNLADYIANYGSTYVALGEPQKCIDIIDEALAIIPELENGMWNQGLAYLELGNYEKGFYGYEFGDRKSPDKERGYHGKPDSTPYWDGTPGKVVVIYGEQGLGDEIMFASILPDMCQVCDVILEAHPRLVDLFRASFPHLTIYGTRKQKGIEWPAFHSKIDAKMPIGSLGHFFRKKKEDFPGKPFMQCNAELSYQMKNRLARLSDKPKIGISWKGGTGSTNKSTRCIDMKLFQPLFDFDVDFISLQYHNNAQAEVDLYFEQTGNFITHWQDVVADYDLTAALLVNLDLVISVPQSVVHLAGALGVKTWQMCPKQALWQMGPYGENMPWYESVINIWQSENGAWDKVIQDVVAKMDNEGFKRK